MRHVLGPGVMRHEVNGVAHDIEFSQLVIETAERIREGQAAMATLNATVIESTVALTAFGEMWLAGILDDDWRRNWYRHPEDAWWA